MSPKFRKIINIALMAGMDGLFLVASWFLAAWLYAYLFKAHSLLLPLLEQSFPFLMLVGIVVFALCGVYKNMWLYAGMGDLIRIAFAVLIASLLNFGFLRIAAGYWQSPAIGVTSFYILFTLSGGVRLLPRISDKVKTFANRQLHRPNVHFKRALVVGAGESASALISELQKSTDENRYHIVALLDKDASKHGRSLHGVRVAGGIEDMTRLIGQLGIAEVIIALPSASNDALREIINACPPGMKVRTLSRITDITQDAKNILRTIELGDLLGRPEVELDIEGVGKMLAGQTVLVTGGGGSIGSEICRQIMRFNVKKLVIFDFYENNSYDLQRELRLLYPDRSAADVVSLRIGSVQDTVRLSEVFTEFKPDVVFHAAAYKHVNLMEQCPDLVVKNNVFGTYNTALVALEHGAKRFVLISTDKAVNPTNIYGASKRLAELVSLSLNSHGKTEFVCVRFGNVLGSNGSIVPLFQKQIENGGPVTVTHPDIIRYFMTIPEASRLVIQASAMAKGGEIFVLDMGEPVKIMDLARNMIRMAGFVPDVDIPIRIVGLRKGEKLYEELLTAEEGLSQTGRDKILVAHPDIPKPGEIRDMLDKLHQCIDKQENLKQCVHNLVPEYTIKGDYE